MSIGVPVSVALAEGREIFTMFRSKASRSVFEMMEMTLELSGKRSGAPRIGFSEKVYTVTTENKDFPKNGIDGTSLFTETRKMGCPSFSLPAGPTYEFGTCPAANQGKAGGMRKKGKTYICDGCYSLEGNYIFPNVALAQAGRLAWVLQHLERDDSGLGLAEELAAAITDYAINGTLSGGSEGLATRLVTELGVFRNGQLVVPVELPGIRDRRFMPVETPLPVSITGFASTNEMRRAEGVPEGAVCGFFRIHDSGDFGLSADPKLWLAYVRAWVEVARRLPHVKFWVPTRMWKWKQISVSLSGATPNLTVRSSALHVGDPAPSIQGLEAGSTAYDKNTPVHEGTWVCPVYGPEEDKSCIGAGCRACWVAPQIPVAYRWH